MFISFILLLGTFPHVIHTNVNNLTFGPRENESARFIYEDPGSHKFAHCMFCEMKALTDSTYRYLQQPACLKHYSQINMTDIMTSYEMDNKKYAFCITGDVPGCGNLAQMSEKSVPNSNWKCDAGYSNSINSVYFSCALIDDITQRVIWNWYCNEKLQWQETLSAVVQLDDKAVVQLDDKDNVTIIPVVTVTVTVTVTCVLFIILIIYRRISSVALVCSAKDVCKKALNFSYNPVETPILETGVQVELTEFINKKSVRPDTYGAERELPVSHLSELKNKQHNTRTVISKNILSSNLNQLGSECLQFGASICTNGARSENFKSDNKRDHLSRSNHPKANSNAGAHFQGLSHNTNSLGINNTESTSGYNSQSTVIRLLKDLDQVNTLDIQSLVSCSNDDNLLVELNGTGSNTVMNNRQVADIESDKHYPDSSVEQESYHFNGRPIIIHRSTGNDEESVSIAQEQHTCNKEKRPEPLGISCEIPCTDEMKDDDAAHNTQPKETIMPAEACESDATEDCTENSPLYVNELN